ncbi:MAG: cell division protein FtsQ/DivIB [Colwellia sp.]
MTIKQSPTKYNKQAWSFGLGLIFFMLVLISLISISWWVTKRVVGQESAPVTSVVISGEMPYTQQQDIIEVIDDIDLGNFFLVDVNAVQELVSTLPWVYSVAVRKQWPNELKIYVVDQTPVALWNGDFLLNQFGRAFQADTSRLKQVLPKFFGPEGSEKIALKNFINLNDLLDYKALAIDELVLSERFSWQLTLTDGVTLNLGRENRVKRIQRFMDIYPEIKLHLQAKNARNNKAVTKRRKNVRSVIKEQNQAVDYIDLRYDTGLAVGWKSVTSLSLSQPQYQEQITNITSNELKLNV